MTQVDPLTWSIPANLRWLAENMDAPRVPCGVLTGRFLISIAEQWRYVTKHTQLVGGAHAR